MAVRLPHATVHTLVQAAVLAPSADNGQPWRLRHDGLALHVHHDPSRALRHDSQYRASLVAAGCLIENVVIAAHDLGYEVMCHHLPGPRPDHVATLRFHAADRSEHTLASWIPLRATNRRLYEPRTVGADVIRALDADVAPRVRADVKIVSHPSALRRIASLAMAADHLRYTRRIFHEELFRSLRFSEAEANSSADGLPIRSLELAPGQAWMMRAIRPWPVAVVLHRLGLARAMAFHTYRSVVRSGAVAIASVAGRGPRDAIILGQAVERLWLVLAAAGLAVQPLSPGTLMLLEPPDAPMRRRLERVREQLGEVFAMRLTGLFAILRLGYASPPTVRSPRRKVDDVLTLE